jgi:ribosomal protein S18 acetylase RimI-like enzyme
MINNYLLEIQSKNISWPLKKGDFKLAASYSDAHGTEQLQHSVDFLCPVGTKVLAVLPGTVTDVVDHFKEYGDKLKFAQKVNYITIQHEENLFSQYLHLGFKKTNVKPGMKVNQGQVIGSTGLSGYMTKPHLHFHMCIMTDDDKVWRTVPANFQPHLNIVRENYLLEIQTPKGFDLVVQKNNLNAPIFKRRPRLSKDLYGKFCENKPCSLITYSWVHNNECIGAMAIIEKPEVKQTKGYKVDVMIVFLHIDSEYRGKNLGGMLVKDVLSKYKKIFLTTDKRSSDVAKSMYEKYGFKIIGKDTKTLWHWIKGF